MTSTVVSALRRFPPSPERNQEMETHRHQLSRCLKAGMSASEAQLLQPGAYVQLVASDIVGTVLEVSPNPGICAWFPQTRVYAVPLVMAVQNPGRSAISEVKPGYIRKLPRGERAARPRTRPPGHPAAGTDRCPPVCLPAYPRDVGPHPPRPPPSPVPHGPRALDGGDRGARRSREANRGASQRHGVVAPRGIVTVPTDRDVRTSDSETFFVQ